MGTTARFSRESSCVLSPLRSPQAEAADPPSDRLRGRRPPLGRANTLRHSVPSRRVSDLILATGPRFPLPSPIPLRGSGNGKQPAVSFLIHRLSLKA
jgi:hypothetical protein